MDSQKVRYALLIRVSTEKQKNRGESMRTQRTQLTGDVALLGGEVAACYGGDASEHATPGWERRQLQQLLSDAAKSPRSFDAIMVTDPSRWSRDHVKSEQDLEYLMELGIRFFTRTQEHDLRNDEARLFLCLSTVINAHLLVSCVVVTLRTRCSTN
jgi:site-specific DNA recombinase